MRALHATSTLGRALIALGLGCLLAGSGVAEESSESDFLSRVRRLTYDGKRAGEGYFSPDGTKMVLQSERDPENPFYQIFMLDLESGDLERVSPGYGKTTCAFIRKNGDVMFSSTHNDPRSLEYQQAELDFRSSGQERRYSWDYDPQIDLWAVDAETGDLMRLTDELGYDAEGSYSPDGEWLVFSSMRSGYLEGLSEGDQKILATDPSYFGEIYIMPAEGGEQTRLTHTPGYDGGPFFSPDGQRIVWRRFDESGLIADIWTMNLDGTEPFQVTDFGSMSWAPYIHPSGEYLFFASNKHGFSNFELFIVDVAGQREPVRVTFTDGFDSLPVPSPDGRSLSWTSTRHGEGGQIYLGGWNHQAAIDALKQAPGRVPGGAQ